MRILAIETSCDETAVALVEITGQMQAPEIKVLANSLFSQAHLHEEYGGVYPNLAKREHTKNLPLLLERTLEITRDKTQETNVEETVDYICVTQGPGLEPALWTGITFAEELGKKWGKSVIPVDHMEGHIWSVLYRTDQNSKFKIPVPAGRQENSKLEMPALALLVSGGHTELVLVKDFGQYEILGKTRDDAVGEAFDKVARMLGLSYPGGPQVSALAETARKNSELTQNYAEKSQHDSAYSLRGSALSFPKPMLNSGDLDFSYSGLKTAVLYHVKNNPPQTDDERAEIARAFEDSAIEVLVEKTRRALDTYPEIKSFILGGGVAANKHLQSELNKLFATRPEIGVFLPEKELSTDNALMIGIAGFIRIQLGLKGEGNLKAQGNLSLGAIS